MLIITVTRAYSPRTHSLPHHNHLRICQRTVSLSISSGLPVSTLTPRCLSWSGFMEGGSYVRGECLYLSANSRRYTDGASLLYDGTFLVGQSVTRVRTPSHTHKSSILLLINVTHRGHRSCTCLSTIVLGLSASLKDPRRRGEVPSILACMINVLLWSGCRRTSHRLAEILARYVHRSSSSAITDITNHDRSPSLERAQERCLHPITT